MFLQLNVKCEKIQGIWTLLQLITISCNILNNVYATGCSDSSEQRIYTSSTHKGVKSTSRSVYRLWLLPLSISLCRCCYHNHSAMSSFKCEGTDVLFHLSAWGAEELFHHILSGPLFFLCLKTPVGLNCSKSSLLRTSCLITYLLDFLSHIFSLKDKVKEKCRLSLSPKEQEADFKNKLGKHLLKWVIIM